jgi:magnesium-transporting ATPase (P-type)
LRLINYLFTFFASAACLAVVLLAGKWGFTGIEQFLYVLFFLSFCFSFLLFSRVFSFASKRIGKNKRRWFLIANLVIFSLFLSFLGFIYHQLQSENRIELDSQVTYARIYRVDPEGYRKKRKIYFTFEHEGKRYMGSKSQIQPKHRIGDSIRVVFSEGKPEANQVLE